MTDDPTVREPEEPVEEGEAVLGEVVVRPADQTGAEDDPDADQGTEDGEPDDDEDDEPE